MIRIATVLLALLTAVAASAQRPLFDPDDFVDPRQTGGRPVFVSRIVIGAASNMTGDGFRPLGENIGYVHLANSFSWRSVQFDYKRSQLKAEDGEAAQWQGEFQNDETERFQPTQNATPKSKDTLHAAWYWPVPAGGGIPVMLRSRVTFATQPIETDVVSLVAAPQHLSGRERTFALDTDTWFRIAGHSVFGSLAFSETKTETNVSRQLAAQGVTAGNRKERAITYTNRFPALSLDRAKILIRPTLTVGGISNRNASGVNLVNPAIEIFRPFLRSGANLHVIWSPQWAAMPNPNATNPNATTWKTTHQVAVLLDRAIFVKVF